MTVAPPRELKTGVIVDDTLGVLERCAVPFLLFIVALTLLNGAVGYYGLEYTSAMQQVLKGVVGFTVGIAAAYFLYEAVLGRTGLRSRQSDDAFLPFIGLAVITTLAIMVGLVALVIPGLYLIARWSIAAPVLMVDGKGPIKAMQDSWERTKGSDFAILVAVLLFYGVPTLASIAAFLRRGQRARSCHGSRDLRPDGRREGRREGLCLTA
jgi:membrane-anchored glycerophosphoryl diester phosphodiesterase (GDPDase)